MQQLLEDLQTWDGIATHRTATPGDEETSRWLAHELAAAGAQPQVAEFHFRRRNVDGSSVLLANGTEIEGVPLFDGGLTPDNGTTGIAGAPGEGEIGVTTFAPFDADPRTQSLHAARRLDAHKGLVAIAAGDRVAPGLAVVNAEHYAAPFGPPVLQVATHHREVLEDAAAQGHPLTLMVNNRWQRTSASNVTGLIAGREPDLAPIVIMTPKSAWWTCTAERGGGIVAWLACARAFAQERPRRSVIFTANTGHELGHVGLKHYLSANPELTARAHAWIHLGANFISHNALLYTQASSENWLSTMGEQFSFWDPQRLAAIPPGQRPLGEARDIYDGAGRYISLVADNRWFHHPDDRLDVSVDLEMAQRTTEAVVSLARYLDAS